MLVYDHDQVLCDVSNLKRSFKNKYLYKAWYLFLHKNPMTLSYNNFLEEKH